MGSNITIINYIYSGLILELDLKDIESFVNSIVSNNAQIVILNDYDIPRHMIPLKPEGFHDEDNFESEPQFPVLVAYISSGTVSKEAVAQEYIKQFGADLDPVMDEAILRIAKSIDEDISSDLIGKVEIIKYIEPWVFSERNNFHLEDLMEWCEAAKNPNVGLMTVGLTDTEIEGQDELPPEESKDFHDDDDFDDRHRNQFYVMYSPANASEESVKHALKNLYRT